MKKSAVKKIFLKAVPLIAVILIVCLVVIPKLKATLDDERERKGADPGGKNEKITDNARETISSAVDFDHELNTYQPKKDHYNFYFTYKTVHAWWDAVALGMEDAQKQFLDKCIVLTYEDMAPDGASAADQIERLKKADREDYDVIGVDVADEKIISPVIDEMIESGNKVMTFSSSDAAAGCKSIAYVWNTHN